MSQDKLIKKAQHDIFDRLLQHIQKLIALWNLEIIFIETLKTINGTTRKSGHKEHKAEEFPETEISQHAIPQLNNHPN